MQLDSRTRIQAVGPNAGLVAIQNARVSASGGTLVGVVDIECA